MDKTTIARRYATALFNLVETAEQERAGKALQLLSRLVSESSELRHVLASPVFTLDEKTAVLTELIIRVQAPPALKAFLAQVLKKARIALLPDIAEAFGSLVDRARGIQRIDIASARPFEPDEERAVQAKLESAIHKRVSLSCTIDPALLAGLRIRMGSRVYDNTLQGRLSSLRSLLAKG